MVDELGPDTNEKIQALCKKISVAHNLDAEIQEELRAHMEDKLLGYLNGEEAVDKDDAFVLVREHFGDPSTLKSLLHGVHVVESHLSLARRLSVAIIVASAVAVACPYFVIEIPGISTPPEAPSKYTIVFRIDTLISVALSILLMRLWQRRIDSGDSPWFQRCRAIYLVIAIAILTALQAFPLARSLLPGWSAIEVSASWRLVLPILPAFAMLQCIVWLWWCDRPPRSARNLTIAACVWCIWIWCFPILGVFQAIATNFSLNFSEWWGMARKLGLPLGIAALYSIAACLVYVVGRRALARARQWREARQ